MHVSTICLSNTCTGSRDCDGSIVTRLATGRYGVRIPAGTKYFHRLLKVQTGSEAQQAPCSMGTGCLSRAYSDRGVKLNTHLHLEPRLGMSGAVPLLPLHAIMA
jgi:hypothetical protein